MITRKEKVKPISIHDNNQLIGFYNEYAVVYDYDDEELYYFFMPEPIESLLDSCVEKELLKPISELPEILQVNIRKEFLGE